MTYNTDLMLDVLHVIEANPRRHDQNTWAYNPGGDDCGTTHCIAGWACALAGDEFLYGRAAGWENLPGNQGYAVARRNLSGDKVGEQDPGVRATELLGISWEEAGDLFYNYDNAAALDYLRWLIAKAKNGGGA